jgi:outer membrane protein, heavy metal efflux system
MLDRLDTLTRSAFARSGRLCCLVLLGYACPALAEDPPAHGVNHGPSTPAQAADERVVPLAELIAFAEQHGPSVRIARQRSRGGAAARAAASPILRENPTLVLGAGPRFADEQRGLDVQASLQQEVEIAGERGLRRAAAARLGERLDAELEVSRARQRRDVTVAYHLAAVERERWALTSQLARYTERALAVAQRRSAAGDATGIEVGVAEADAARARAAELAAEHGLWSMRIELCLATGWPAQSPPVIAARLEPPRPPPELDEALRRAGSAHPELALRRATIREAHAGVELADRRRLPAPTLGVQLAREGSVGSPANYIVLGSVGLPLPLWTANRGEREQSRVEEDLAREEAQLILQEIAARVARSHHEVRSAAERVQLLGGAAAAALEEGLRLLERGFEQGESSLLELSVGREALARARLDALEAYADYYRSSVELDYWMNGGLPQPTASAEAAR